MKILLIDDHQMFREGISTFLSNQREEWDFYNCESINSGIQILEAVIIFV